MKVRFGGEPQERQASPLTVWLRALLLFSFIVLPGGCTEALAQADGPPLNLPGQIGGRIA
jgi:hypothetical protein